MHKYNNILLESEFCFIIRLYIGDRKSIINIFVEYGSVNNEYLFFIDATGLISDGDNIVSDFVVLFVQKIFKTDFIHLCYIIRCSLSGNCIANNWTHALIKTRKPFFLH